MTITGTTGTSSSSPRASLTSSRLPSGLTTYRASSGCMVADTTTVVGLVSSETIANRFQMWQKENAGELNTRRCRNESWQAFRTIHILQQVNRSCQPLSRMLSRKKRSERTCVRSSFFFWSFGLCGIKSAILSYLKDIGGFGDFEISPILVFQKSYLTH